MDLSDSLSQRFSGHMGRVLGPDFPSQIGLAVSGGADSMAMLALTHGWARVYGVGLHVVTIDHGLRAESAAEAAMVAEECAILGHSHTTLRWHWDGTGNLQEAARRARLDLIGAWRKDIAHVLFAHTQDDQAETLLMRLKRGSGVEGLSAMAEVRDLGGWYVVRPLLSETRADLRHHARVLKLPFVDDPSNDDTTYERVRIRQEIAALGLDTATLTQTAVRMARAQEALAARAADVARNCVREYGTGDLLIDRDEFSRIERDTQLRVLAGALQWVASAPYRPRSSALEGVLDRALGGGGGTLHGAEVRVHKERLQILREFEPLRAQVVPLGEGQLWDHRWWIEAPDVQGLTVRALGPDGWAQLPDGRTPPFHLARTLPALFEGARLVAFAAAGFGPDHTAVLRPPTGTFVASLLSR